mgnify:CR=1 FL=1
MRLYSCKREMEMGRWRVDGGENESWLHLAHMLTKQHNCESRLLMSYIAPHMVYCEEKIEIHARTLSRRVERVVHPNYASLSAVGYSVFS